MIDIEERKRAICYCGKEEYEEGTLYSYLCTNCFKVLVTEDERNLKFCPYCGAKYEKIEGWYK